MLQDIERKVLRVIANFLAIRRRAPSINELCIKTGRSRNGILDVLSVLAHEDYIKWDRTQPELIDLVEAWERNDKFKWRVK